MVAPGSASTLLSPTSCRIAPTPQLSHLDDALGPHAVTSTANVPPAPISSRITAGTTGRPPRWCSWWRAPPAGRPARRRRRSAAGSPSPGLSLAAVLQLGTRAGTSTASRPPAPTSSRATTGPAGRPPRWWRSRRALAPGRPARRRRRPAVGSPPARPVGRHSGAAERARRHQAGQHASGADQLQDHRWHGRSAAAMQELEPHAGSRPASAPLASARCRISAGLH